jgi:hypothetical protein
MQVRHQLVALVLTQPVPTADYPPELKLLAQTS